MTSLDNLSPGASARLVSIGGERAFRCRLMEMGLLPGTAVRNSSERIPIASHPLAPRLHRKLALVMRRDKILTKGLREALKALQQLA